MATIYDVAKKAGVSIGTVSRYVNGSGYVGQATRVRIEAAIGELSFSPNSIARSLTTKRTWLLGFIASDLMNPFVPEVARGIQDVADEQGYCVLILNTDGDGEREVRSLDLLRERRVDGFIITPPETPRGNDCIRDLHRRRVPIVLLGREVPGTAIDRVSTDTYAGSLAAMTHLIALGHRRIAYAGGAPGVAAGRRQGYLDSLRAAGVAFEQELLVESTLDRDGGLAAARKLLALGAPPTAIFCVNDLVALGVVEGAERAGFSVPGHLSVVGFDDIVLAAHARPALTSVAQPKLKLGRTAAQLLISRIEREGELDPREVRLPCELVARESSAAPSRKSDPAPRPAGGEGR